MQKQLSAVGNSLGLIIDKPILDLLNITRETILNVRTDDERLIIEPVRKPSRASRIKRIADDVLDDHDETFKKLAK